MVTKFEAKKHGYRQTKDGVVVSFVLHPNDVDPALAAAPLGTVYALGLMEIPAGVSAGDVFAEEQEGEEAAESQEQRRAPQSAPSGPWDTLELKVQAGIRCNDDAFQKWIGAGDAKAAADRVRAHCKVESRKFLVRGTQAGARWLELDRDFQTFLGSRTADDLARAYQR